MDVDGFVRDGYVVVRGAFSADTAAACREIIWESLAGHGIRRDDPATWRPSVDVPCPSGAPFTEAATSPALAAAYDELIGPGRWTRSTEVGGLIPVRFPSEDYPGMGSGYHIEGSYEGPDGGYWANVRSRGRGLLALFLFSDTGPDDAPTRLVKGSHLHIPPILQPYGEAGINGAEVGAKWRPSVLCRATAHATGRAGDVYLCHPFVIHTATWPHRGPAPRMMAQPAVHVPDGFVLDGSDPSPVARAIVTGLATPT